MQLYLQNQQFSPSTLRFLQLFPNATNWLSLGELCYIVTVQKRLQQQEWMHFMALAVVYSSRKVSMMSTMRSMTLMIIRSDAAMFFLYLLQKGKRCQSQIGLWTQSILPGKRILLPCSISTQLIMIMSSTSWTKEGTTMCRKLDSSLLKSPNQTTCQDVDVRWR